MPALSGRKERGAERKSVDFALTLIWPRNPQTLAASNGRWATTQFSRERIRSSLASKRFTGDLALAAFGIAETASILIWMEERNDIAGKS
jgi:hypothetical protein